MSHIGDLLPDGREVTNGQNWTLNGHYCRSVTMHTAQDRLKLRRDAYWRHHEPAEVRAAIGCHYARYTLIVLVLLRFIAECRAGFGPILAGAFNRVACMQER